MTPTPDPPGAAGPPEPPGLDDAEPSLEVLLGELRSAPDLAREEAARAMRDLVLGPADEGRWRAALRAALGDADATVRYYAIQGLGRVGDPALLDALVDPAMPVRREAVTLLGTLHDAERLTWAEGLADEVELELQAPDVSLEAAVGALCDALGDPSFEVREAAFHALGDLGPRARAAVPQLLVRLAAAAPDVIAPAAGAAGEGGAASSSPAGGDEGAAVRALAAEALGRIGREARAALPLLRQIADDETQVDFLREAAGAAANSITGAED